MEPGALMLAATRRIEDEAGALTVLPAVRGMGEMAETFAGEARTGRSIRRPSHRRSRNIGDGWSTRSELTQQRVAASVRR